jgi:uncharacterized OB-fold protein/acyl dehydratase
MNEMEQSDFLAGLRAGKGKQGSPETARDPVNQAMIRHWCDAMEDHNPVYTDVEFASRSIHGGIVAPPAMLNAWGMRGLEPSHSRPDRARESSGQIYGALDAAGYTSVVATNSEHEYPRYLRLGDELSAVSLLEDVSDEKKTALGVGHFVTTLTDYRDQHDELVGRMRFRILKFKPGTGAGGSGVDGESSPAAKSARPQPGISRDTAFFWQGLEEGELRVQQCDRCEILHHPPMVRCPECGSREFGWIVSSGRGTVYSFVEPVHPNFAAFDPPYVVGLVELEEGTRLLTNIVDLDPESVRVGMPVEVNLARRNSERTLPFFRPQRPPRREMTRKFSGIEVGAELDPTPIPISATLIVATAIASRDYQDVHHDRELAIQRGSPDIFMNILTTSGLCARYVTDWAGPGALLKSLSIRLGVPNYPHDTMTMSGSVLSAEAGRVEVGLRGYNRLGNHVTGSVELELPESEAPSNRDRG